jgi:hypothetical protein
MIIQLNIVRTVPLNLTRRSSSQRFLGALINKPLLCCSCMYCTRHTRNGRSVGFFCLLLGSRRNSVIHNLAYMSAMMRLICSVCAMLLIAQRVACMCMVTSDLYGSRLSLLRGMAVGAAGAGAGGGRRSGCRMSLGAPSISIRAQPGRDRESDDDVVILK